MKPVPLFRDWERLAPRVRNKDLLLFLDYDGTLTPIVSRPHLAVLTAARRGVLRRLARRKTVRLAAVSGRQVGDLRSRVGVRRIFYVGNHGMEIDGPGFRWRHPDASAIRAILARVARTLRKKLRAIPGVFVEDKGLTLSVHYRVAGPSAVRAGKNALIETMESSDWARRLKWKPGKKVWEIRPAVDWNKGRAVRRLLAGPLRTPGGVPVYIGDDRTDEDAFRALGARGITVKVLDREGIGPTAARYTVGSVKEVYDFLKRILAA
jgi:trehalose 6-phosphate phosphatase